MERQVLAGLLPIQSVEPVLSFIAQRMPLEKILKLEKEDERDVLAPSGNEADEDSRRKWTADDLLSSYAEAQGSFSPISSSLSCVLTPSPVPRIHHC